MAEQNAYDPADDTPIATDPQPDDKRGAGPGSAAGAAADVEALKRERDDSYDRLLRKTAEFDNYRKRIERERREQADHVVTDLLTELLNVVDDFERALAAGTAGERDSSYRKGIELNHTKLQDLLRKRGVRAIDALGADFDPNVHQAVLHESSPGHREGEVIGELRKGYMLGDRLLRPAMVKVAKA
jgi:molecular chaperone GrpE